jgi:3-deoxy-D-manno-octulosonic-acid transferase
MGRSPRLAPGAIWVHGASVGEVLAASRLVDALRERGRSVVVSTMTTTGRAVFHRARPEVPCTLAPLDHPWSAGWALARVRPRALVLIETELWPSWIAAAERSQVPVMIASGRLSERGFARYRRFASALRRTFRRLGAVGARSEEDAERFAVLGVPRERLQVTGDLKLEPPGRPPPLAPELARILAGCAPLVAASTHDGEEAALLDALEAAERAGLHPSLVLAPRHPQRARDVVALAKARRRRLRLRSQARDEPLGAGEVLLLDTLGELPTLLPHASIVFVGGSLAPIGGHNVVEPAWAGRAVLFGPHMENWKEASVRLLDCGGAQRVADASELARAVTTLLADPEEASRRGQAARREVERHCGATARSVALLGSLLGPRSGALR